MLAVLTILLFQKACLQQFPPLSILCAKCLCLPELFWIPIADVVGSLLCLGFEDEAFQLSFLENRF